MNKQETFSILIVAISFLLAIYFYPQLPEEIPIHWNAKGEVDGYSSKEFGLFLMPAISLVIYLFMKVIPKIDPLRNIGKFQNEYEWFIVILLLFLFSIQIVSISWALGYEISMLHVIFLGLAVLFFAVGSLMEKAKRNWFIGIRTPWTLSSEKVWDKTHRIGSKLFKTYSILLLIAIILDITNIWMVILGPIILIVAWAFIYSYFEFEKEKKLPRLN